MRPWGELAPEFSFRAVAAGDTSSTSSNKSSSNANNMLSTFGRQEGKTGSRGSVTRFFDLLVPTPDTVCFAYLLDKLLSLPHRGGRSPILVGPAGVGKSVVVQKLLETYKAECEVASATLHFSATTS